ncbi:MAG: hypothetical protein RMZ69_23675 [Nostoc sp. ChiQUE01a]|nr:hypothetical protein [Nostoc sp. ChiQUE01a]
MLCVTRWLSDNGLLFSVGGRNKLATLVDRTVTAVNIDAFADLVMEKYQRRQLIKGGTEIIKLGYATETELPVILDQAEQKVYGIASEHSATDLVHISDSLADAECSRSKMFHVTKVVRVSPSSWMLWNLLATKLITA